MFSFEDILQLPPQRIAAALSGVAGEELAVGLRTASEEVKQKILSSLSSGAAKEVVLQMDRIGPVRLIEVEAAQQRIAEAVRRTEMGQYVSGDQDVRKQLLA
jgi:flagellar motor switch protein FliG